MVVNRSYFRDFIAAFNPVHLLSLPLMCMAMTAQANLAPMSNEDLSSVDGQQVGVLVDLEMRINQDASVGKDNAGAITCTGANLVYCRLGVQFNQVSSWLLLKGLNGYIHIPQILLYGANLADQSVGGPIGATGTQVNQSAIAINIAFPSVANGQASQIKIRNLGFTLGLQPEITSAGVLTPTINAANDQASYYKNSVYQSTASGSPYYSTFLNDTGKETGLMGVQINGNLNVGGTLYVFAK